MERSDVVKELAETLREAYLAGKAAERPFDRESQPEPPADRDGWHH